MGHYLPISFLLVVLSILPFYLRFERRNMKAEEIVLVASLAALGAMGRVPFAAIPGVQPTSFIVIMAGLTLGAESGFVIGSTAAIVSNLFLGQGPWTPWQMLAWGSMGLAAGLLRRLPWMHRPWGRAAFGFVWGFLYGWIMNLWFVLGFLHPLSWQAFAGAFAASAYFDLSHALANATFLLLFGGKWSRILGRVVRKFGLLGE
ncbi:ECF transporter S component [Anaerotalea alkaliphila]|uniref:ECF transporter S component n=1 Tax=Anaerotalea alkaliphila TaxID=2662126 RepID=A0A7X5HV21_9FIRM|nr:ECF transporter S component [Anaerotalea alkaliphila]NDL67178.1 ECF transporter S component [Anaerotalea alkaliphila]